MKKIFTLALCFFITMFTVGCTFNTTVNLVMDGTQPWAFSTGYEQCVYKVTKKDAKGTILGEGILTNTAWLHHNSNTPDEIANTSEDGIFTTVQSEFSFTPSDSVSSVTDTIISTATFLTESCAAIKSEKTVTIGSNPNLSYKFVADYENKKVDYYMNGSSEITKTLPVPASEKIILDNESLYYVTRAFNPENEKEGNFLLTNLYDCYAEGRISSYSVYYRASSEFVTNTYFEDSSRNTAWSILSQNLVVVDDKVECYHAKINRNRSNMSGAPIEMWFSKKAFSSGKKRVMIKMRTTTLTIPDANVDYTMEYDLVSYTTSK